MKVSVVTTILNEENSIGPLLDSLLVQTKKPDEIVIVDGGSGDRTVEIIEEYRRKTKRIKLVMEKGSIAHGRNVAVRKAKYKIVAQIDGGCVAEKHWLARITEPFKDDEMGVVAGFYKMVGESCFQEAVAPFHGVPERRYDPRVFLPSGRSVAFRKEVWRKVGGYSESLERAGEDTLFNYHIFRSGVKIVRVKKAIVYWKLPRTLRESMKKLYYYAKGDGQALIWWHPAQRLSTHSIKIFSVFGRYLFAMVFLVAGFSVPIFFYVLLVMAVFYMCWAVYKTEDVVYQFCAKLWVPAIQFSCDLMVMAGFVTGLLTRISR
jgi:glycosyltransferase involved in cell wall biosynthesis